MPVTDSAMKVARQYRAAGGPNMPMQAPWTARAEARGMNHVGPITSPVPGRTDNHPINVPAGSYVVAADVVSGLGQGNTQAGQAILKNMFSSGPYGASLPRMGKGKGPPPAPKLGKFADGGGVDESVPIMAAGGEFVVPPDTVAAIGGGDMDLGHKILDQWMVQTRKKHVKELKALPGPAK